MSARFDAMDDLLAMRTPKKSYLRMQPASLCVADIGQRDLNFRPALAKAKPTCAVTVQSHQVFLFPRSDKLAECIALPLQAAKKLIIFLL